MEFPRRFSSNPFIFILRPDAGPKPVTAHISAIGNPTLCESSCKFFGCNPVMDSFFNAPFLKHIFECRTGYPCLGGDLTLRSQKQPHRITERLEIRRCLRNLPELHQLVPFRVILRQPRQAPVQDTVQLCHQFCRNIRVALLVRDLDRERHHPEPVQDAVICPWDDPVRGSSSSRSSLRA